MVVLCPVVKEVLSASRIFGALDPSQNFYHWKDSVWRGLAMIYGYRAYSDPHLIIAATTCWTDAANRIIKPDQYVVNGYPALQTSDGKVVYAGCHLGYNSEFSVRSVETVLYMLLSAHLAECTNYDEYKEIALQTAERVKTIMWDSQCKLVKDLYINVGSSYGSTIKLPMSCYATGLFIEGLCVLASITGDGTWTELMIEVATAAIRWPNWHSSEGILIAGSGSKASLTSDDQAFRGILLRSLVEAYRRNPSNNAFRSLIKAYINVQFNAIYELARRENVFGVDWRGPFKGPFLHAQLAALDVIVAAIAVNDLDG
ncbi:hypothetical protein FRC03_005123 [Tulasnella sp. 419]|nr:hypothetical protein FRC03_005123 [Tulasnella sp. 419]